MRYYQLLCKKTVKRKDDKSDMMTPSGLGWTLQQSHDYQLRWVSGWSFTKKIHMVVQHHWQNKNDWWPLILPYAQVLLHWWDWSCGSCGVLSLDTPNTQAVCHLHRKAWVQNGADCRMVLSDFSPVGKSHTGSLEPGWEDTPPLSNLSCRLDIPWILWFPRTSAGRCYRCCEYRSEEQDPCRYCSTQDRRNPLLKRTWMPFVW